MYLFLLLKIPLLFFNYTSNCEINISFKVVRLENRKILFLGAGYIEYFITLVLTGYLF